MPLFTAIHQKVVIKCIHLDYDSCYEIVHILTKFTLLTNLYLVRVAKRPSDYLPSEIAYNLPQAIHPIELTL